VTAASPGLEYIDAADYPFSHAFAVAGTLFISLDATFFGPISERERMWLRGILERHGARHSHRVVFSHVPLCPFAAGREADCLGDEKLEALLREGRVDLVLSGHHHAYFPSTKDGLRYVSQAWLGAAPRTLIGTHARA
jgi:hypothetical protein